MGFFQWRHAFHDSLKEIVEDRNTKLYRINHIFNLILMILYLFRALFFIISNYYGINLFYINFKNDPLFRFLKAETDMYEIFSIFMTIMTTFTIHTFIHFYFTSVDQLTFQVPYELTVLNRKQIECSLRPIIKNGDLFLKKYRQNIDKLDIKSKNAILQLILRLYCWHKTKILYKFDLDQIYKKKLIQLKLNTISNISIKFRLFLLHANLIIDYYIYQALLVLGN